MHKSCIVIHVDDGADYISVTIQLRHFQSWYKMVLNSYRRCNYNIRKGQSFYYEDENFYRWKRRNDRITDP